MAAIPDSEDFTLQDVQDCLVNNDDIIARGNVNTLAKCLGAAPYPDLTNEYGWDPLYEGNRDRLSNFRNYDHNASPTNYQISLIVGLADPVSYEGATGNVTFRVSNLPNSVTGTVVSNASWIKFLDSPATNTNMVSGDITTITIDPQPLLTSPERAGTITVSSASTGVTNSPRVYTITQEPGPDFGGPIP